MRLAGLKLRLAAVWLDILGAAIVFAVAYGAVMLSPSVGREERLHSARGAFLFLWLLYSSLEAAVAASPGKLILGMRILRQNGREADPWRLILRWSIKNYWLLPAMVEYFVGDGAFRAAIMIMLVLTAVSSLGLFNEDHLTGYDLCARTAVFVKARSLKATGNRPQRRAVAAA